MSGGFYKILSPLFLIIGILIFLSFINIFGFRSFYNLFTVDYLDLFYICLITFIMSIFISFRWKILIVTIEKKQKVTISDCFNYFLVSQIFGLVLPRQATDVVGRVGLLYRNKNISLKNASLSVILDRSFDFFILILLLISVLPYWFGLLSFIQSIILSIIFISIFIFLFLFYNNRIINLIIIFLNSIIKFLSFFPGINRLKITADIDFDINHKALLQILILSFIKFFLGVIRLYLIAISLNLNIPFEVFLLGSPLGQLVYITSITPGGLGFFEAGWYGILILSSIGKQDASLFVVFQRIIIIFSIIIIFLIDFVTRIIKSKMLKH